MKKIQSTPKGVRGISSEEIAGIAGEAASSCYGIVGLVPRNNLLDAAREILAREEYGKGIYVRKLTKGYEVDVYVACAEGVKIPEVLSQAQKKIAYELSRSFPERLIAVNVYCADIQEA